MARALESKRGLPGEELGSGGFSVYSTPIYLLFRGPGQVHVAFTLHYLCLRT
jgi:hypothetical protein